MASDGNGARRALSWRGSAGSSSSHIGHAAGPRTTGIRLCSSGHSSFGVVVTMVKLRTAGERQLSYCPASAIMPRSASAIPWASCRSRCRCRVGNRHYWQLPL
jgi:hypothetical protein